MVDHVFVIFFDTFTFLPKQKQKETFKISNEFLPCGPHITRGDSIVSPGNRIKKNQSKTDQSLVCTLVYETTYYPLNNKSKIKETLQHETTWKHFRDFNRLKLDSPQTITVIEI